MARRAIHSICDEEGAVGSQNLVVRLQDLRDKGKITQALFDWANELREAGKRGAHPEWESMTQEEAQQAIALLEDLIRYIYIQPSEVNARRLKAQKNSVTT